MGNYFRFDMIAYFRPLKRKLGVLTLVTSCALMVGWLRSQSYYDMYYFGSGNGTGFCRFGSHKDGLLWIRESAEKPMQWPPGLLTTDVIETESGDPKDPLDDYYYSYVTEWRWRRAGIDAGEIYDKATQTIRTTWVKIPYWSIIIPLSLFSTWLLLRKL